MNLKDDVTRSTTSFCDFPSRHPLCKAEFICGLANLRLFPKKTKPKAEKNYNDYCHSGPHWMCSVHVSLYVYDATKSHSFAMCLFVVVILTVDERTLLIGSGCNWSSNCIPRDEYNVNQFNSKQQQQQQQATEAAVHPFKEPSDEKAYHRIHCSGGHRCTHHCDSRQVVHQAIRGTTKATCDHQKTVSTSHFATTVTSSRLCHISTACRSRQQQQQWREQQLCWQKVEEEKIGEARTVVTATAATTTTTTVTSSSFSQKAT